MEQETVQNQENRFKTKARAFLNYLITTTNGMAYGLFATLIIGVIFSEIGKLCGFTFLDDIGTVLKSLMGIGIGVGVALSLKKLSPIELISAGACGAIAGSIKDFTNNQVANNNPLVIYVTVIITITLIKLVIRKKTPVDIILIPLLFALVGYGIGYVMNIPLSFLMNQLSQFISYATSMQPFLMGIVIAVVMGMCLTAPISSAAIATAIKLGGIAGGAAVVGCSVQMIGFAVMSIKDNNIGKVISVGIGTSMLQFKNVLKKPVIWLPTIITSAILAPFSTLLFQMESDYYGAGMGTCALVGQLSTISAMGNNNGMMYLGIALLHFILPAVLVFLIDFLFRKIGLIKAGDLAI